MCVLIYTQHALQTYSRTRVLHTKRIVSVTEFAVRNEQKTIKNRSDTARLTCRLPTNTCSTSRSDDLWNKAHTCCHVSIKHTVYCQKTNVIYYLLFLVCYTFLNSHARTHFERLLYLVTYVLILHVSTVLVRTHIDKNRGNTNTNTFQSMAKGRRGRLRCSGLS